MTNSEVALVYSQMKTVLSMMSSEKNKSPDERFHSKAALYHIQQLDGRRLLSCIWEILGMETITGHKSLRDECGLKERAR